MNTNVLVNVAFFTAGALIGSFVALKMLEHKYEEMIKEDIESIREVKERKNKKYKADEVLDDEPSEFVCSDLGLFKDREARKKASVKYNDMVKDYVDAAEEIEMKPMMKGRTNDPYVITCEEFSDENHDYEKTTIYYYVEDDILMDEGTEEQLNIDEAIGYGSLDSFGKGSVNPDILYVRNDHKQTDYEVVRVHDPMNRGN